MTSRPVGGLPRVASKRRGLGTRRCTAVRSAARRVGAAFTLATHIRTSDLSPVDRASHSAYPRAPENSSSRPVPAASATSAPRSAASRRTASRSSSAGSRPAPEDVRVVELAGAGRVEDEDEPLGSDRRDQAGLPGQLDRVPVAPQPVERRFGVRVDPGEVSMHVHGGQEGVGSWWPRARTPTRPRTGTSSSSRAGASPRTGGRGERDGRARRRRCCVAPRSEPLQPATPPHSRPHRLSSRRSPRGPPAARRRRPGP